MMLLTKEAAAWFNWDTAEMPFYNAVKQLHRWLFMKPAEPHGGLSVGRVVMAISSMAMSLVLLSGVVIWWPKNKKMLKNRLTVTTNKGFRRFVYDSHVSLGIYAFVFLFLMAVTGPVFSFGWYKKGMSSLLGQSSEKKEMPMTPNAAPMENAPEKAAAHATAAPQDSKDTPAQQRQRQKERQKVGRKEALQIAAQRHVGRLGIEGALCPCRTHRRFSSPQRLLHVVEAHPRPKRQSIGFPRGRKAVAPVPRRCNAVGRR